MICNLKPGIRVLHSAVRALREGGSIDKAGVDERLLVRIWERQLVAAGSLATGSGEPVQVIYPGRENRDSGPDFLGAVIATDGGLLTGDVELHRRASDWVTHRHQHDPGYNDVILQVVWEGEASVMLQNGRTAPTLSLRRCLAGSLEEVRRRACLAAVPDEPCHDALRWLGADGLGGLLDGAGEERFRLKASRFAAGLRQETPSQALYRGIMGALGYTKNREQFEELAGHLPLATLGGCCRGKSPEERVMLLRELLLGTAGLSPEEERTGQRSPEGCPVEGRPMSRSRWRLFRVRPENHPARRIRGAACLLARFMEEGLLEGVLRLVSESRLDYERLEAAFTVDAPDSRADGERALIGRGRAREIVVNIILPFAFARAEAGGEPALAQQALSLYRSYPAAGENEVTRRLARLLGVKASAPFSSAQRQQGLLHLDKSYCVKRWCGVCPIGQRLAVFQKIPSSKSQRKHSAVSYQLSVR